ncbi:MAG: RDD family protein [Chloroflexi bacterium]|nr:RDD family protein [Chloroflexota bacterium]
MEPTGSPATPPDEASAPQAAPPPPPPAAPPAAAAASTSPAWLDNITSQQTIAGPAGLVYADIPSRIFAYIIDAIILGVAFGIVYAVLAGILWSSILIGGFGFVAFVWLVVLLVVYAAGSAVYFIYTWTRMRGSPGQRVLGLETLNAADGAVLTQPQAIRRWLFLFGPFVLAQVFAMTGWIGILGSLLSFVGLAWAIYLLYTTANSPSRQGFHDVQASTVVVKVKR